MRRHLPAQRAAAILRAAAGLAASQAACLARCQVPLAMPAAGKQKHHCRPWVPSHWAVAAMGHNFSRTATYLGPIVQPAAAAYATAAMQRAYSFFGRPPLLQGARARAIAAYLADAAHLLIFYWAVVVDVFLLKVSWGGGVRGLPGRSDR